MKISMTIIVLDVDSHIKIQSFYNCFFIAEKVWNESSVWGIVLNLVSKRISVNDLRREKNR